MLSFSVSALDMNYYDTWYSSVLNYGTSNDGTGKVVCIKSDKTLGTCTGAVSSQWDCQCA